MPRLAFLQIAITKYGFSNAEIAQKVELNQTALNYYFRNDDIYMSRLNQIANAMGATLNIRITKVIAPEEVTRPRLHTEIVTEKKLPLMMNSNEIKLTCTTSLVADGSLETIDMLRPRIDVFVERESSREDVQPVESVRYFVSRKGLEDIVNLLGSNDQMITLLFQAAACAAVRNNKWQQLFDAAESFKSSTDPVRDINDCLDMLFQ